MDAHQKISLLISLPAILANVGVGLHTHNERLHHYSSPLESDVAEEPPPPAKRMDRKVTVRLCLFPPLI
jgi:hypothetical protein